MKAKYFFLALSAIALGTSCSNDEVTEVSDSNAIKFSVSTGKMARAYTDGAYCNNNLPGHFIVWASYDSKTYINGDKIVLDGNAWTNSDGLRYWPDTDSKKVNFYAHVNGDDVFNFTNCIPSFQNYTVSTTLGDQKDLLYAVTLDKEKTTDKVIMNFRHALSQIVFKAKNTNENLHVDITSVSIVNVNSKGNFTFPTIATTDKYGAHQTGAITNPNDKVELNAAGQWAVETPATYVATISGGAAVPGDGTLVNLTDTEESKAAEGSNPAVPADWSNVMLLLPQETTAWNPNNGAAKSESNTGAYFLLNCKIRNVSDTSVADDDVVLHDGPVAIPVDINWLQGKKYIYTFIFAEGQGGYDPDDNDPVLTPITFNVTVDDFVPVADKGVNMDVK